jgi:hypothetical protein
VTPYGEWHPGDEKPPDEVGGGERVNTQRYGNTEAWTPADWLDALDTVVQQRARARAEVERLREELTQAEVKALLNLGKAQDAEFRLVRLREERDRLADASRALLDGMGVELDDDRMGYIVVQLNRADVGAVREALPDREDAT